MKMTTTLMAAAALACMIAACDGPKEKAGAAKDEAAGVAYIGDGPVKQAGATAGRIDRAAAKARDSQADALKDQGIAVRKQADARADELEQQAQTLRDQGSKAKTLDEQAEAFRKQP